LEALISEEMRKRRRVSSRDLSLATQPGTCPFMAAATVPGRGENLVTLMMLGRRASMRATVALWSSSVSPGNPVMTSVESVSSGTAERILRTIDRKASAEYALPILSMIGSDPLCTGRCRKR